MKLLSLCNPLHYARPPLDVPTFYQRLSRDPRVTFYHVPTPYVVAGVFSGELPKAQAIPVSELLSYEAFVALGQGAPKGISLEEIDVVFCRTLKPYAPHYLDLLSGWEPFTRFVNRPSGKRSQMKSDFLMTVASAYMPETIVSESEHKILAFFEKHQTIVAKRANSTGGRGVFKIFYKGGAYQVDNVLTGMQVFPVFSQVLDYLKVGQTEPVQFCRYLTNTTAGDKRVVVVDGEIYGSYLRRSKSGHWVNNVSADGACSLAEITPDEREAIACTASYYQALGLHTLGYDFLMDDDGTWRISEINAGNIGGFARLELLTEEPVMDRLIDWLIAYSRRPLASSLIPSLAPASAPPKLLSTLSATANI